MGLFKKDEVYDYTLLQKKGYLKTEEPKPSGTKVTKDGYFELGSQASEEVEIEESGSSEEGEVLQDSSEGNALGFFDNFSANNSQVSGPLASFDSVGNSSSLQSDDVKDLSVKLEDFEYKLARIADKLAMIEARIEEFERRTEE